MTDKYRIMAYSDDETLKALDGYRLTHPNGKRILSRSEAILKLIRIGLTSEGYIQPSEGDSDSGRNSGPGSV